jgi:transposase
MNQDMIQTKSVSSTTTPVPPAPIVCWVGLDWADKKHCLVVRATVGAKPEQHLVEHKPEALDAWFLQLRQQHSTGRIAVAIEQSRGPVLYALLKHDFLAIYPVNPRCLADYRRAFKVSGAKDDPLDANLLCELVSLHPDRLRPLAVEDIPTRQLRLLVEARRGFVHDSTALSNRLGATLKCYYPLALELVGEDLTTPMALDFLRRWPNLAKLQAAKPAVLRAFFYAHNSRSEERIQERLQAVRQAKPLTEDPALIMPLQVQMEQLVQQLRSLQRSIALYDQHIKTVFAQHSEAWLFKALPGAGPVLAPRLAAAFGTLRANFASAHDLLCFSGVAPVRKQSGGLERVQFRYARPIFLHQSIVEFAKCSIPQCAWAKLLFQETMRQGKSAWAALRKVAFKWLRILWRCWQQRQAYDEVTYLRSLQRDGVELYRSLYQALPPLQTATVKNS